MSKLLQYLVNKPSVKHKVLPGLRKMQMAGQYNAERDATSVNTPALSKLFGVQREVDVNRFSEDAFKEKYKMTPHQYKMRTDSNYAQAFQRQMDERRQNDPNYSEINLPATDIRSKNYKGNPNLALIPKGATGPARAQQEQLFADMTSLSAPLLPVKSLVRGLQVGKAATTAPKIIDKLISTPSPVKTAATQSADNSGLIINDEVYRQWRNARQSANISQSPIATRMLERIASRSTNAPSGSTSMEAWGTPNWNAAVREPAQNIEPYRAVWEGFERRTPEWITQTVRDWPTSNMSFVDDTRSILSNVTRGIDQKLGRFFSKGTTAPAFDADEVSRLINENLSKGVGVKKENLPLQVKIVPTGYSPDDFRIETLIDNNKVGSIFFQRNMNPYKPKTFSQQFLNKAQSPFEKWQSTPGFKKKGDYPFSDYDPLNPVKDPTGKTFTTANDLYSTGISGEFNKAINEAFKAKGLGNVLSGGTGHSLLGEARWQNLVKKGLAEDLGAGYFKLKKQGGPVILPKMQMRGEVNLPGSQTISVNDPRYPEMYKNRQVGAYYDGAFTLPDLDEVVVRGKDERIKEGMSQGINKFYGHTSELMSAPQTEMMKFLTGKRQIPSQAWGFDTTNKSWYHPKTVSNFLMDASLDPTNLIGVGVLDDLTKGAVRASAQNTLSKTLQRGISPFDYSVENILRMPQNLIRTAAGKSKQFSNSVQSNIKSGMAPFILQGLKNREDAWSVYLGLKPEFNSMRVVGYDDATGLTKYEYTNPSVFGTASRRPNPKDRIQDQRMDQGLYDSSEGKVYNKRILQSDYGDDFDIVDLNVPGSSTVGNDRLFGVMGGFQKYVSPDGKSLMYRDVWDIQPFSRLTSSQLPRDMVGNAIRRFEVSSLIPGARPFVAEGKLGDIKTKFLPAKPYENIKTRFNTELENLKSVDPEGFAKDPQRIREEARRLLAERIKNERTFLNSVEGQGLRKYVDTNPYTRFGDTTPDLAGFDFDPLIPIPKKVLGNIKKIQDFANQPVTKFNMGGPILDPRGQWAHPGKVTRIPGSDITMQGVPYPVLGVGSNGQEQMMYPGQDYNFGGASYVDEYPMMQFGGGTLLGPMISMMPKIAPTFINMFSGDPLKKFIKWVNEPSEATASISRPSPLPVEEPVRTYGYSDTYSEYRDRENDVYSQLKNNDTKEYNSPKQITLSSGRFRGAKVDPEMINDIVKVAKDNDIDPWVMLSLVGRESTFGSGTVENKRRAGNKQDLVSGWNVAEEYMPYEFSRFLADKKVPGIEVYKDSHGWKYLIKDKEAIDDYLKKNPSLIDTYYDKLESTPKLGKLDSFALAAQRIKKKGIQNYNPGDPKYPSMVNADMNLLKSDAALKEYMKSKGYKQGGEFGSGLLSKSVSCSNCGWSWKAVEGGINPLTCHKCGGKVKMQGGGQPDSTLENIFEVFDPSGMSSWDDVYQSYQRSGMSPETKLEIFGALPMLGKLGKAGKLLGPGLSIGNRKTKRNAAVISNLIQSIPYIGRGTDAVQAIQQTTSAPFFPSAPPAGVGQFGRYAGMPPFEKKNGGQHGGLDRWFAEKWVDVKTGKACGRQEGESRAGYPACRPSKRVSSETPKTSSEMSSAEKAKFKRTKTSSERIPYNHKK